MPEANVLYSVTAAVVLGLVAWVAFVLKSAKEPWGRPAVAKVRADDVPVESAAVASVPPSSSLPKVLAGDASGAAADTTAEATAVVVEKKPTPEPEPAADEKAEDAK